MAKSVTPYFSHDANARNDERIIRLRMRHGAAGYGVYFMLLERLREQSEFVASCDYDLIAFDLHVDSDLVKSVIEDFRLFDFADDDQGQRLFYSQSFMRRMQLTESRTQKRREAANKRWNNTDANSDANASTLDANAFDVQMQMQCNNKVNKIKEINKIKESKEIKENKEKSLERDIKKDATTDAMQTLSQQSFNTNSQIQPMQAAQPMQTATPTAVFTPPTIAQVKQFAMQQGLTMDAAHFVNYYTAIGWRMGHAQMLDWKAAALSWARREQRNAPAQAKAPVADISAQRRAEQRQAAKIEAEYQRRVKEAVPPPADLMQRLDAIAEERRREVAEAAQSLAQKMAV
jgi:hypothetical protein